MTTIEDIEAFIPKVAEAEKHFVDALRRGRRSLFKRRYWREEADRRLKEFWDAFKRTEAMAADADNRTITLALSKARVRLLWHGFPQKYSS